MVIDHVAWKIAAPLPVLFVMHLVGRMTMPLMSFLVAEGFRHTTGRKRYALRLLIFGLIAQLPFNYYWSGDPFAMSVGLEMANVLFDLLFGLCALWIIKSALNPAVKVALVALCLLGSLPCDWFVFGVLWILAFGLNSGFKRQAVWFSLVVALVVALSVIFSGNAFMLMNLGAFLVLPLLARYNGKKAGALAPAWLSNKWLFYAFYPAHLLILGVFFHWPVW